MLIENVKNSIIKVLGETKIKSLDHVYEQHKDQLKLIISFHNLNLINDILIHTKLIFNVNDDKTELTNYHLTYLYNLNCEYNRTDFKDNEELEEILTNIFYDFRFGDDLKNYSRFLKSPARMVNEFLEKSNFKENTVLTVDYQPKFNITKCSNYSANFDITLNNDYKIELNIKKEEEYIFTFNFLDNTVQETVDTLELSIPALIGNFIMDNVMDT